MQRRNGQDAIASPPAAGLQLWKISWHVVRPGTTLRLTILRQA
jgi:hypothetical protein